MIKEIEATPLNTPGMGNVNPPTENSIGSGDVFNNIFHYDEEDDEEDDLDNEILKKIITYDELKKWENEDETTFEGILKFEEFKKRC